MRSTAVDSNATLHAAWTEAVATAARQVMHSSRRFGRHWALQETVADSSSSDIALTVERHSSRAHLASALPLKDTIDPFHATNRYGIWNRIRAARDSIPDVSPAIALERDPPSCIVRVTREPAVAFRIELGIDRTGTWVTQPLHGRNPDNFGLGTASFLAISPAVRSHFSDRGGNCQPCRTHHTQDSEPGAPHEGTKF